MGPLAAPFHRETDSPRSKDNKKSPLQNLGKRGSIQHDGYAAGLSKKKENQYGQQRCSDVINNIR
jgi:hypothetical protein